MRKLTPREQEVLKLIALGDNTKTICAKLEIASQTADWHRHNIYTKLGVQSNQELTLFALANRMIQIPSRFFAH